MSFKNSYVIYMGIIWRKNRAEYKNEILIKIYLNLDNIYQKLAFLHTSSLTPNILKIIFYFFWLIQVEQCRFFEFFHNFFFEKCFSNGRMRSKCSYEAIMCFKMLFQVDYAQLCSYQYGSFYSKFFMKN